MRTFTSPARRRPFQLLPLLWIFLCLCLTGHSQEPCGPIDISVPAGTTPMTLPGRNPCLFSLSPSAVSGTVVTFTGGSFTPFNNHVLEIAGGPGKGHCSDVVSNTANTITTADDLSTWIVPGSSVICVRKAVTLSQIFGLSAFEDIVIIKTPGPGGVIVQQSYMFDGVDWVNVNDGSSGNDVVLDPCEPFCFVVPAPRVAIMDLCRPDYNCCDGAEEDCCSTFDPGAVPDWKSQGTHGLSIGTPGPSGAASDGYLAAQVKQQPGWFRVSGPAPCPGDWTHRLTDQPCLQLCWDVRLFSDGNDMATIPYPATIQLCSGTLCATFTVNTPITENGGPNGGWYRFCAPIELAPAGGPLPSNAQGSWSGVTPAQWNSLLTNVTTVTFASDPLKPLPNSKWGWDNICLEEGDCDCLDFVETGWTCQPAPGGGYTWTLTGTVTNNSIYTAHKIFILPLSPPGMTLSPNQITVNLPPGGTQNISITFSGVAADTLVCFRLVLFNREQGECCVEDICVKTPCVKIEPKFVACTTGGTLFSMVITNTTAGPITGIYLIGQAPAVISPSFYSLGSLAPGASTTITGVTISGFPAGGVAQFQAIIVEAGGHDCCVQDGKVTVPACPQDPALATTPFPVAPRAEPCPPVAAPVPPPVEHKCAIICCETLLCDPARPNVWTYSFVVQNATTQPMTQLLFPSPQISPAGVTFAPPLLPGQAASVTITITGVPPGPFVVPMLFFNAKTGECCSQMQPINLICDCAQVIRTTTVCAGSQGGFDCINTTITVQNLTGTVVDVIFLTAVNPVTAQFTPDTFNVPGLAPNAIVTLTTQIKVPPGTTSLTYYLTLHDKDFVNCCATGDLTLKLPDCCDCVGDFVFEGGGPALPTGVNIVNLERDAAGKLGFGTSTQTWPFVCMAVSGRGTIVRIDANTGAILGEYRSAPEAVGANSSPSRTTVDRFGECWVGNRNDNGPVAGPFTGAVVRIGLVIGGTRGTLVASVFTPNPTGEYLQGPFTYQSPSVWDRNGDGYIRTSYGLTNVLDWDPAPFTNGNQSGMPNAGSYLADDELITNYVRVAGLGVRGMAIDANNDLWAGGYANAAFQKVSGVNGSLLGPVITSLSRSYGALVDANNMLWSVDQGNSLYRYDITANSAPGTNAVIPDPELYGIGIDRCTGEVWTSSVRLSDDLETDPGDVNNTFDSRAWLRRFSPAGNLTRERAQTWPLTFSTSAQGLCVDRNGIVWVSATLYSRTGLQKYDPVADSWTSPGLPAVTLPFWIGYPGSTGCAEDHLGRIWVSDNGDHAAHRYNPGTSSYDLTADLGDLAAPYNYSDMTGAVALNAGGQTGILTAVHDSLCPGTDWGRVTWNATGLTPDCWLTAEVRASDNPLSFPNGWTPVSSGASFCGKGIMGRYIEVRIIFFRPAGANCVPTCNPKLCWLKVECCDNFGSVPVITLPGDVVVAPGSVTHVPGEVAVEVGFLGSVNVNAAWIVDGGAPNAFTLSGADTTGSGWAVMPVEFTGNLPAGQHTVALRVVAPGGEAMSTTTVIVADQAPQISGLPGLSQAAFSAPMPDYRPLAAISDDLTPRSALIVTQSPPPGTVVTQGSHFVTVTVRDGAGHTAVAQTTFWVRPVLRITEPANYSIIPAGQDVRVNAALDIPAQSIAGYRIELNSTAGPQVIPADSLPHMLSGLQPGEYSLRITAVSLEGLTSTSAAFTLLVLEPVAMPQPMFATTPAPGGGQSLFLRFQTVPGSRCCVQKSTDLATWVDFKIVKGTGREVDILIDQDPTKPRVFFRIVVQHEE